MRKRWIGAIALTALAGMSLLTLVEAFPSGMDIEAMQQVAGRVRAKTQDLQTIEVDLQAQALTAQQSWQGPDASQWLASMNEQTVRLRSIRSDLEALAQALSQNISAVEGAAGGGAAAPRPRVRVLMKPPAN